MLDVYERLRFHDWWTREQGAADESGVYQTRAFLGTHKLHVKSGDFETTVNLDLARNQDDMTEITVVLSGAAAQQ